MQAPLGLNACHFSLYLQACFSLSGMKSPFTSPPSDSLAPHLMVFVSAPVHSVSPFNYSDIEKLREQQHKQPKHQKQ